jgi:hypothetical protein
VNQQQYESYMDRVQDTINRCGWMCQAVGADGDGPSWVYTIGLEAIQQAEMVVVNLSMEVSAAVMNRIGLEAQAGTRPWPVDGDTIDGILANGYCLRALSVDPDIALGGEWFNMALNRRRVQYRCPSTRLARTRWFVAQHVDVAPTPAGDAMVVNQYVIHRRCCGHVPQGRWLDERYARQCSASTCTGAVNSSVTDKVPRMSSRKTGSVSVTWS